MPHDPGLEPMVIVVMGVSGSGKSTVGALLAGRLGWAFADGDAFHDARNIAKMRAGIGLDDADRAAWLADIAAWIDRRLAEGLSGVMACSALKRAHRETLARGGASVRLVHLSGDPSLIARRLAERRGHFMPASLLASQIAALEPPGPDEGAFVVDIDAAPEAIAATIARRLGF